MKTYSVLVFSLFLVIPSLCYAQKSYDSADIDVDGTFMSRSQGPSEADRLARERRELENKNEDLVRKKIEDMRMAEERKMTEKIQQAMDSGFSNTQAAPVATQAAPVATAPVGAVAAAAASPVLLPLGLLEAKIGASFGYGDIKNDHYDFATDPIYRVYVEGATSDYFSFGMGFLYSTLEVKLGTMISPWHYYKVEYDRMSFDFYAKFSFASAAHRFRPFVRAGLSYVRTTSKWDSNGSYEFRSNFPSVFVSGGGDFKFTPNFGATGLISIEKNLSKDSQDWAYGYQQKTDLELIGAELRDSVFYSLSVGLFYSF